MTESHSFRRQEVPPDGRVSFTCDGDIVIGCRSDTVASALLAAGRSTFHISPHDGQPRGGFCFVGRCSDCQMVIDGQPGSMACLIPVRDGMIVETQTGPGHWEASGAT